MDLPTSWTDDGMNFNQPRLGAFNPYILAISEAVKERAIEVESESFINPILLNPVNNYDARTFAYRIEQAIDILIIFFLNPDKRDEIFEQDRMWTWSDLLTKIGASSRISYKYYTTSEWVEQQYAILNQFIWYRVSRTANPITRIMTGEWTVAGKTYSAPTPTEAMDLQIADYNIATPTPITGFKLYVRINLPPSFSGQSWQEYVINHLTNNTDWEANYRIYGTMQVVRNYPALSSPFSGADWLTLPAGADTTLATGIISPNGVSDWDPGEVTFSNAIPTGWDFVDDLIYYERREIFTALESSYTDGFEWGIAEFDFNFLP